MGNIRKIERAKGIRYVAQVRIKGSPNLSKTFKTEAEAKIFITQKEAKIQLGGTVSKTKINNTLLSTIFDDFVRTNKTILEDKTVIYTKRLNVHKEHLINFLSFNIGMLTIETLTHDKIKKFFNHLLITPIQTPTRKKKANPIYNGDVVRCYSEATICKYFSLLRELCEDFAFMHNFDLGNRFTNHDTYQSWNPREQRITPDDETKIYKACDTREQAEQFRQLFKLGINTGMRASELIRLKASNCYLTDDKRYIYVAPDTNKMKASRSVPLSLVARQVLIDNFKNKTQEEIDSGIRVFDKLRTYSLDSMIKRITFSAGNPNICLSDCRHEFLCRTLEETDIDVVKLSLATGHNLATLIKYANQFRPLITAMALDKKK